jgi:hypothetical protein
MRAAGPAARPPHPFFKLRAHPFDMLPPGLILLDGDGPAYPFVARERRNVFPSRPCFRVGRERLAEVGREVVYDSGGDSNGCHRVISLDVALRAGPSSTREFPAMKMKAPGQSGARQRWMRAEPPAAKARTWSRLAIVVSPGNVVSSAPWAQPSFSASSGDSPVRRP